MAVVMVMSNIWNVPFTQVAMCAHLWLTCTSGEGHHSLHSSSHSILVASPLPKEQAPLVAMTTLLYLLQDCV